MSVIRIRRPQEPPECPRIDGKEMQRIRQLLGLNTAQLAEALGKTEEYVRNLETVGSLLPVKLEARFDAWLEAYDGRWV